VSEAESQPDAQQRPPESSALLAAGRAAQRERRRELSEALTRTAEPEPARQEPDLDALADLVAERVLAELRGPDTPDTATADALQTQARRELRRLSGRPTGTAEERRHSTGFDGGARARPPTAQSHEQWLLDKLVAARAHRGGGF
jgi:hypothetical protein